MNGDLENHRAPPPGPIDLLTNPFHVLGIAPGATIQQVQSAFDRALESQPSSTP
jgi:hypothetical protein